MRDYAAGLTDNEKAALYPDAAKQGLSAEAVAKAGMADMSKKFLDMGAEVYVAADKAKEANEAL